MKSRDEIIAQRKSLGLPHWKLSQSKRLRELMQKGAVIAYWNSDAHGYACNGGSKDFRAYPGLVQQLQGPLHVCYPGTLHATRTPHKWVGSRVWMVAMHGEVKWSDDKCGALHREFIGEILPSEAVFCPSVAIRLGVKDYLTSADLTSANLTSADLTSANLMSANLTSADLTSADLRYANLRSADLTFANLRSADLMSAYRGVDSQKIPGWRTLATGYLEKE